MQRVSRFLFIVGLLLAVIPGIGEARGAASKVSGGAIANPAVYVFVDVKTAWNAVMGPLEKLAVDPAVVKSGLLGEQLNFVVEEVRTQITKPLLREVGLNVLQDISTVTVSVSMVDGKLQFLMVVSGNFENTGIRAALAEAPGRVEVVNSKELRIGEGDFGGPFAFQPAVFYTGKDLVVGDIDSVKAAAMAKNFKAGKVAGLPKAASMSKAAGIGYVNWNILRAIGLVQSMGLGREWTDFLARTDEWVVALSEREIVLWERLNDDVRGQAMLDLASGVNQMLSAAPYVARGLGLGLLGIASIAPEEIPEEFSGLLRDRKGFLKLVETMAGMAKASGKVSFKKGVFEWRISGSMGISVLLGAGAYMFLGIRTSSEKYPSEYPGEWHEGPDGQDLNEQYREEEGYPGGVVRPEEEAPMEIPEKSE